MSLSAPPREDVFLQPTSLEIKPIQELVDSVQTTTLETSVNVRYPNTPYDISVSVTRTWRGMKTNVHSDPMCTISMRGINWDEGMTPVVAGKQLELGKILAQGEQSFRDGFVKFIQCVKHLQMILGEVHPGDPTSSFA